ncbi:class I SAM-dependent methyltransferase [Aerococcaceae bacterium zg-B36]|uniref:class I SAM-dependent methyltransferase n=1 Tax=Aerococcaceae bacterium zg-252 TaxID=2796928 RepID=UPI001BD86D74|nr:class I SAM-dependent methyltransferase [Aerococcaceae bacterium zg-B36]
MSKQNIFDNEVFFEGYSEVRNRSDNANILFEIPALFSLLGDLSGKEILDLGCGYGGHCKAFIEKGALKVIGIDISSKMIEVANNENSDSAIEYMNIPMENIDELNMKFDVVVSSLAFHYVEDYRELVRKIYHRLRPGGLFVFSQEHPINTTYESYEFKRWTMNENGNKQYANLANYGIEGVRNSEWFIKGIKKYHRTFSTVINNLIEEGFSLEKIIEPFPDEVLLQKYPNYVDLYHKPDFLLVKVSKR